MAGFEKKTNSDKAGLVVSIVKYTIVDPFWFLKGIFPRYILGGLNHEEDIEIVIGGHH